MHGSGAGYAYRLAKLGQGVYSCYWTNPLPLVVPCHRVLGADGALTGYGGGLHLKVRLLAHEGVRLNVG